MNIGFYTKYLNHLHDFTSYLSISFQPSKTETSESIPKLKSIIVTGSKIRIGSQDSSEKQVTFQDSASNTDGSLSKIKKVKFADDTKFNKEDKIKRS